MDWKQIIRMVLIVIVGKEENKDMLTPKFNVGDRVCTVTTKYNKEYVNVKCDICKSTGEVKIRNKLYRCPECNGRKELYAENVEYVVKYVNAEIGKVTIEEYSLGYVDAYHKNRIYYMLGPTGVGSGQVYDECDGMLFKTLEEAEDFCKKYIPVGLPYDFRPALKKSNKTNRRKNNDGI